MIRWLASYPKSGNTWVRLFFLAYADPDGFHINNLSQDFTTDTNPDVYEEVAKVELQMLTTTEAKLLRGAVLVRLSKIAYENTGGPVYLKSHSANVGGGGILWIPPDYTDKSIYLVRDPRDVAVSLADHMGFTIDDAIVMMADEDRSLDRGFDGIHVPLLSWSFHVGSWWRNHSYNNMVMRYEDLTLDPNTHFQSLLTWFDIKFDR